MENRNRLWTRLAMVLLLATALVPLAAPVFPTQDGPVHLYYVDVLRALLTHSAPYAQYFTIKNFLTPYALEYYVLLVLEFFFSPVASEKILVAGYIFAFGFGFRYLVESVAERGSPWILAGIPFCLNMLVYMGFLNYSMATAMLLAACGFWIRHFAGLTIGRVAVLLAGLMLMLLTHPVPAAVFLAFTAVYLAADAVCCLARRGSWRAWLAARRAPLALMAAMGAASIAWVSFFFAHPGRSIYEANFVSKFGWFDAVATELQLYPVAAFRSLGYRAALMVFLALAFAMLLAGLRKNRLPAEPIPPAAVALAAASCGCFLLFCIAPERVNGSFYFAERFPILWVLFFLAAVAGFRPPRRWSRLAGGLAAAIAVSVLIQQTVQVSAIGWRIARLRDVPRVEAGSVGLIVGPRARPDRLQFNPFLWAGVHYFRRSRAILANDPWMDMPQIMLRPVRTGRWSYLDPNDAQQALVSGEMDGPAGAGIDFVLEMGPWDSTMETLMRRAGWSNVIEAGGLAQLYRRR